MEQLLTAQAGVPQAVCFVDENYKKYAIGGSRIIASGWQAGEVIQSALDWVRSNGYGTVVIKDRMVIEKEPLVVPTRVRLHCDGSGVLVNKLSDQVAPFVEFRSGSTAGCLRINANSRSGIQLGEKDSQSNVFTDRIYLFNVGTDGAGIATRGYQVVGNWWHVSGDGGYDCNGFDFRHTSDLFINSAIAVSTGYGARFDENEHVFIPTLDCDSGSGIGILIGKVHDMRLGCTVWCNSSSKSDLEWSSGITVNGPAHTVALDANIMRPGRVGMRLSNIAASRIYATITNRTAYPAAPDPMDAGLKRGKNIDSSARIDVIEDL